MTPNEDLILLRNIGSKILKWLEEARDKRTTTQIKCPYVVEICPSNTTAEDEELGTDHRHGMFETTAGPGTIHHDARPLSRYWNAKKFRSAGVGLDIKRSDMPRLRR